MALDLTTLKPGAGAVAQFSDDFATGKAADVFEGQKFERASEGISGSYGLVKYGGKVWSLQYKGQTYPFMRPDGDGPRGTIEVVFVRVSEHLAKTFYPDGFREGSREKPTCWSNDGLVPDPAVPPSQKQHANCGACPKSQFGSRVTDDGNKAKACSDAKRTAVVLHPDLAASVLGAPLSEAVLLRIPAASLTDFGAFFDMMEKKGFPPPSFICRIGFDATKNYPKFTFFASKKLTSDEGKAALMIRDENTTVRIVADSGVAGDVAVDPPQAAIDAALQTKTLANTTITVQTPTQTKVIENVVPTLANTTITVQTPTQTKVIENVVPLTPKAPNAREALNVNGDTGDTGTVATPQGQVDGEPGLVGDVDWEKKLEAQIANLSA